MFLNGILVCLTAALALSGLRVLTGATVWDRLLGFSLMSTKITLLIVIYALISNSTFYLDIALLYLLLGFVGMTAIANFLKRRSLK